MSATFWFGCLGMCALLMVGVCVFIGIARNAQPEEPFSTAEEEVKKAS